MRFDFVSKLYCSVSNKHELVASRTERRRARDVRDDRKGSRPVRSRRPLHGQQRPLVVGLAKARRVGDRGSEQSRADGGELRLVRARPGERRHTGGRGEVAERLVAVQTNSSLLGWALLVFA